MDIDVEEKISRIIGDQPSNCQEMTRQLATFLNSHSSPDFLYIFDPLTLRMTSSLIHSIITELYMIHAHGMHLNYAHINCVECFTPRLIFNTVLNSIAQHEPTWEEGCKNWSTSTSSEYEMYQDNNIVWDDSLDSFIHGLRAFYDEKVTAIQKIEEEDKSKGSRLRPSYRRRRDNNQDQEAVKPKPKINLKLVLLFDKADRLIKDHPDLVIPLTRLAELTKKDITTIFLSDTPWEHVCPSGSVFDPYRIAIKPPSKNDIITSLSKSFPTNTNPTDFSINPFMPILRPLFLHFIETVYDICSPFTNDADDLAYIIAARWNGFVDPLLEDMKADKSDPPKPPSEDARIRLTRLFSSSISNAVEILYPRLMNTKQWRLANSLPDDFRLSQSTSRQLPPPLPPPLSHDEKLDLPRLSMFVLIASYLASFNPAKSDIGMFGKMKDEKRRKRKGGSPRKTKPGSVAKIPQRLLGPASFPLDRLIAIVGVLLEDFNVDERTSHVKESAEMEVYRLHVSSSIQELVATRLLHRITPLEKIDDGSAMYKTAISYEIALKLAREVGIVLSDFIWDPS